MRDTPHGELAPLTPAPSTPDLLSFVLQAVLDPALIEIVPRRQSERTWVRIAGPGGAEAWVIGWPPGARTGWHDHGGAQGAFAVSQGVLAEYTACAAAPSCPADVIPLRPGWPVIGELPVAAGRAFGSGHVHDVRNPSSQHHAISVHAYYPALPLMRRYAQHSGALRLVEIERPGAWV